MANPKILKQIQKFQLKRPELKFFKNPIFKTIVLHTLVFLGLFTGVAYLLSFSSEGWLFSLLTISLLFIGAVHTWAIYEAHSWSNLEKGNGVFEIIFTVILNIIGAFILIKFIGNKPDETITEEYISIIFRSCFIFSVPFFLQKLFYAHLAIPDKEFVPIIINSLEDIRGKVVVEPGPKGIIWKFENNQQGIANKTVRMYLPRGGEKMNIEMIFKAFLLYYNFELEPSAPIQFKKIVNDEIIPFKMEFIS